MKYAHLLSRLLWIASVLASSPALADELCSTSVLQTCGAGSGTGTVTGPGAACADNQATRWNGATTTAIQCSDVTISDPAASVVTLATTTGNALSLAPATNQVFIPSGTLASPSLAFAAETNTGIFRQGAALLDISVSGNSALELGSGALKLGSSLAFGFTSGAATASLDTHMSRESAGIIQFGSDVNGATAAYSLKSGDGITGTDIAGANLTLAGGRGTGAGAAGDMRLQAAPDLATGTTAQTLSDRIYVRAKAKALTAAVATTFATVSVASGSWTGGTVTYAIVADDATDFQSRAGVLPFAAVNKAGTVTCTVGTVGAATEVVAVSAGTLTNTFTCAANGNAVDIKANAASSLAETTLKVFYAVHNEGPGLVTP